jgi:protoheme ferro-lyase
MIQQRLEIATDSKVAIHRLRQHMKPYGVAIQSKRCLGYWLEPETKQLIRDQITPAAASGDAPAAAEAA